MPMQISPKKTVFIDFLQNEKRNIMPKSTDNHAFLKENGHEVEPVNIPTPKRTEPVYLVNQPPSANAAKGHLVYARRKPKTESLLKKVGDQHQTTQEKQTQEIGSSNCNLSLSIAPPDCPKRMSNHYWDERYGQLQDYLEVLDHSNQGNYVQMLRSLPPEGLRAQALELEKKSILLSMEEDKELQRAQKLGFLGKNTKNSRGS